MPYEIDIQYSKHTKVAQLCKQIHSCLNNKVKRANFFVNLNQNLAVSC